jgi:hypothetical protein
MSGCHPTIVVTSNRNLYEEIKEGVEEINNSKKIDQTNPKDLIGSKKVSLSLIPPVANVQEAVVMKLGADKYGAYNWRDKKVQLMIYLDAISRHLSAYLDGESIDPESGVSHIAHIRANTGIVLDAESNGNLIDNRPTSGKASEVMNRYSK